MEIIFSNLQKTSFLLAFIGGFVSSINSIRNNMRTDHGCGEYSGIFTDHNASSSSLAFFIPTLILFALTATSGKLFSTKLASFLVTACYAIVAIFYFISNEIKGYAICDSRGDDSSIALLLLGIIGLPMLWFFLVPIAEIANFVYCKLRKQF